MEKLLLVEDYSDVRVLLLARDHVLTATEIAQLARLEASEKQPVTMYVAKDG